MRDKIQLLRSNVLLVNSVFLMGASGAVAAFGFVFWTVVAQHFADSTVGLAATLLSLSSLISLLSLAGFDTTFVRFLPKSSRREDYISSGFVIASALSALLSIGCLLLLPSMSPELAFVVKNPLYIVSFIVFNIFSTLNILTNSVFLAFRRASYILVINSAFSVIKVVLPFIVTSGGPMTIFILSGIAQLVGLVLSIWAIRYKCQTKFSFKLHLDIVKLSKKYAFGAYISSMLNLLPPTLLPLIITRKISTEASAYYFMAFTIANLLYTIAYSSMQSVFSEGSHDEEALVSHLKKGGKLIGLLLLPSIVIVILLAHFVMGIFGESYASQGTALLQLFSIGAIFVSTYAALGTTFKVRGNIRALVVINIVYSIVILAGSYTLSASHGLMAIGWSWIVGNIAATLVGLAFVANKHNT